MYYKGFVFPTEKDNVFIFPGPIGSQADQAAGLYQDYAPIAWQVPTTASMIHILGVGGGGGGGAGGNTSAAATSSGGGGGGGGAVSSAIYPTRFLPSTLYIFAGRGGTGSSNGASDPVAGVGGSTVVSIAPYNYGTSNGFAANTATHLLFANGGGGAGSGLQLTGTAGAAGNSYPTTDGTFGNIDYMPFGGMCGFNTFTGGTGGAFADASANLTFGSNSTASYWTCGGARGGTLNAAKTVATDGGSIVDTSGLGLTVVGGTAGANGQHGYFVTKPSWFVTGGAGGGANTSAVGGNGGNGGPGCGGGGGGAGAGINANAKGGDGGPGFVIITCW
jgi:hypothetical protein